MLQKSIFGQLSDFQGSQNALGSYWDLDIDQQCFEFLFFWNIIKNVLFFFFEF